MQFCTLSTTSTETNENWLCYSIFQNCKDCLREKYACTLQGILIIQSIRKLVQQPKTLDVFNRWKNRNIPTGFIADVYDGAVWKSFLEVDGKAFLASRYSIGLLINVDWFQPYTHIQYSVGAIYIAILNYPRQLRYLRENMLLVGIIPGPHEPTLHINSFLEPLVEELLLLWKGIEMDTTEGKQVVCAALLCNSSDIPATRKVAGFMGHAALKGCSRCLKSFPTTAFGDKADYGGFDIACWPERTYKLIKGREGSGSLQLLRQCEVESNESLVPVTQSSSGFRILIQFVLPW